MDYQNLNKEMKRLVKIMEKLRGAEGCPWDRKQDYFSLKPYILEEAYEVVEALNKEDISSLKEELGDLLLQVVFQAQIGRERGDFDLGDIMRIISDKLIRRHPHVFGDDKLHSVEEVKTTWNEIKDNEKREKEKMKTILDKISRRQPALNQAYEIQEVAAKVGFDWDYPEEVVEKIEEELEEVKEAVANVELNNGYENNYKKEKSNKNKEYDNNINKEELEKEIGDLLFAAVNLTRFYDINPEIALLNTINKFASRFKYMKEKITKTGDKMRELDLEELDYYWEESKKREE
uniref:MazG family protein n=1 Tax=uncultured organism TaxID=155900 RepID=M1PQP9_9ZZZZ|nr:MazG family protein [uncultured organism]